VDPNLALQSFLAAVAEGDDDCADEYHENLSVWLRSGGFAPFWSEDERRLFEYYRKEDAAE
jgi:hypothetical protein